jgi:hypothetical protein
MFVENVNKLCSLFKDFGFGGNPNKNKKGIHDERLSRTRGRYRWTLYFVKMAFKSFITLTLLIIETNL